jgi:Flp pilus assembly protein TadD
VNLVTTTARASFSLALLISVVPVSHSLVAARHKLQEDGDSEALHTFGVELYKASRFEEAAQAFVRTVRAAPDWSEAQNDLGLTLESAGFQEEAAQAYQQAILLEPRLGEAHLIWD